MSKTPFHGSDIEKIATHYHLDKTAIINYGSNVNPICLPDDLMDDLKEHISLISKYPDPAYTRLYQAISNYTDIPTNHLILGNGVSDLITVFIKQLAPRNVLILGPTYSEYEKEVRQNGGQVTYYGLQKENDFQFELSDFLDQLTNDYSLVIFCNPNNPTSTAITTEQLTAICQWTAKHHQHLLVDETYIEFVESIADISAISLINRFSNLIVLRGFSKFFATPGLRLGYGLSSDQTLLHVIQQKRQLWQINALTAYTGERLLQHSAFQQTSHHFICQERQHLYHELKTFNQLIVYPATANFFILRLTNTNLTAPELFEQLIHRHMMIRDLSTFPFLDASFFRFCLLKSADNQKLLTSLRQLLKSDRAPSN